jgi:rSAM/selenodomain-associated transferase 1
VSNRAVIVFLKNPIAGKVKTRLASSIGDEKALKVYKKLMHHTINIVSDSDADIFLFFSPDIPKNLDFPSEMKIVLQNGSDLGEKMKNAFRYVFEENYEQVVIVGSDCPELKSTHLNQAFSFLDVVDVVFGPAIDGGYYLLGMKKLHDSFFEKKQWSTDSVLMDTLENIRSQNLDYSQLEKLSDLDTIEDYKKFPEFQV